ncbi:MAG TPA: hypothetical protein VHG91_14670 [Longimicrobium sp.]|nr:hypothetical protein [Longimicrobium sp.]
MRSRTYYRASLFAPVLVPLALAPGVVVFGKDSIVGIAALLLGWATALGFAPYAVFVTAFLAWSRGKDDATVRRAALRAPFRFIPVLYACVLLLVWWNGTEPVTVGALFGFGAATLVAGLLFGYLYVAVAEVGHRLLARRGWIEAGAAPEPAPPPAPAEAPLALGGRA